MDPDTLAVKCEFSPTAGKYCIEAFKAARITFEEAGYVKK
jgi:putative component of membrane protein insertase Oxa1/YidC/SpoIIIJ protein YidD